MNSVEEIEKEIKSLKGKIRRLKNKNKALDIEYTKLKSIPEEKRSLLDNVRISEIKLDAGNNNLTISSYEFYIKELEKQLASEQTPMQPS